MTLQESQINRIEISADIAQLLSQISKGWVSPSFRLSEPAMMQWGDENLTPFMKSISVVNDELTILCNIPDMEDGKYSIKDDPFAHLWNKPLSILCKDKKIITARCAYSPGYQFNHSFDQGVRVKSIIARVKANEWKILDPKSTPILWVGELGNTELDGFGNLSLISSMSITSGHFRLQGEKYIYYIIKNKKREAKSSLIAIQTDGHDIDMGIIYREIKKLAFSFGQCLRVKQLFGLTLDGSVSGNLAGDFGVKKDATTACDAPIPIMYHDVCWIAPFFRTLCENKEDTKPLFDIAIYYYLDSLSETLIDGAVVKRILALTSICKYFLDRNSLNLSDGLIANKVSWATLKDKLRESISSTATPVMAKYVLAQLDHVGNIDFLNVIEIALEIAGLALIKPIVEVLNIRTDAMFGILAEGKQNYFQLSVLRTLSVALIAKIINYNGAISGWSKEDPYFFYKPAPSQWWPLALSEYHEAKTDYIARCNEEQDHPIRVAWPLFARLTVPEEGMMGLLGSFAADLGPKTNDIVVAKIQPIPSAKNTDKRIFDFIIMAKEHPNVKLVLFTIELNLDGELSIIGWRDDIVEIKEEQTLMSFLQEISTSQDVQERVQRMIQTSDLLTGI